MNLPNICNQVVSGLLPDKYSIIYSNEIMTDGVVLPSIVQEYYLMKKLITRLGTILLNEVELGVVLEPSFTDVVLQMYRLSYNITTTVKRIIIREGLGCIKDENPAEKPIKEVFDECPKRFVNLASTGWDYYLLGTHLYEDLMLHQLNRASLNMTD
ncbi:uncharacterized protein [Dysidea avara]|uniref:uncharacterized protein n=1 Tax=Dysidea avara TaxID=196820 RepID=UPI00332E0C40